MSTRGSPKGVTPWTTGPLATGDNDFGNAKSLFKGFRAEFLKVRQGTPCVDLGGPSAVISNVFSATPLRRSGERNGQASLPRNLHPKCRHGACVGPDHGSPWSPVCSRRACLS